MEKMIEAYSFGTITIAGKTFDRDVLILPGGRVVSPWWRERGHELALPDIEVVVEASPAILVVGSGSPGMMKPAPDLAEALAVRNIRLLVQPTKQAVGTFNRLQAETAAVAACLHLTC